MKTTLVIGASPDPSRYSYMCIEELVRQQIPVLALGLRDGNVFGITIQKGFPAFEGIGTISLYIGAKNQPVYYDYILNLHPVRVIFNPGTENSEFEELLTNAGIEVEVACTIMMLHAGVF